MAHYFVGDSPVPPATWKQALPDAHIVGRDGIQRLAAGSQTTVWLRIHEDGELEALLAALQPYQPGAIVVLCDQPTDEGAAAAIAAGAAGYCNTHAAPEVLRQVEVVVANGGLWIGRSLVQRLIGGTAKVLGQRPAGARERWSDRLSEREREVARLVANGASNKEIADRLAITERTVKAHLGAIFEKLEVRDRLQLSLRVNGLQM